MKNFSPTLENKFDKDFEEKTQNIEAKKYIKERLSYIESNIDNPDVFKSFEKFKLGVSAILDAPENQEFLSSEEIQKVINEESEGVFLSLNKTAIKKDTKIWLASTQASNHSAEDLDQAA